MNLKLFKHLGFALALFVGLTALAFIPSTKKASKRGKVTSISYQEKVETFTILPDGAERQLHDFDKLDLVPVQEEFRINRTLNSRNEMNEERIWLSTSKYVADYQSKLGRFVSDENGSKLFDTRGKLLVHQPISEEGQAHRISLAQDISKAGLVFPHIITRDVIDQINREDNDMSTVSLGEGQLGIVESVVDDKLNYRIFTVYQALGNDQYVPVRKTEINSKTSYYSGVCLEEVTRTSYSNYSVNGRPLSTRK